jgi:disulfide bond formation protein DsbB
MKITTRLVSLGVLAVSVTALGLALTAQYVFGLLPCNLCLIQRGPFVLAAILALLALRPGCRPETRFGLMWAAGLLIAANGLVAFYHVGVERHWWESAVCAGGAPQSLEVDDLAAAMNQPTAMPSCDTPAWSFHGITMAALNIPFSLAVGLLTLILTRRARA